MDIRDYLKILRRRKLIVIVSGSIVLVSYLFLLMKQPLFYEASASIMLTEVSLQERILRSLSSVTPQSVSMNSQLQLMQSKRFAKLVAKKLHKTTSTAKKNDGLSAGEILSSVSISRVQDTNLIDIRARAGNPKDAMAIAKAYAEVSTEENNRIANVEFKHAKDFIAKQLRQAQKRLKQARKEFYEFNQESQVGDFAQVLDGKLQKINEYEAALEQLETEQQEKQFLIGRLREKLNQTSNFTLTNSILPNPVQEEMRRELSTLEMQLLDLREKYTDEHPKVVAVKNKIKRINERLKTKVSKFIAIPAYSLNPLYTYTVQQLMQEELALVGMSVKKEALLKISVINKENVAQLSKKQLEYARRSQDVKTAEHLYNNLLDMHEQMRVSEATKLGNAQTVDIPDAAVKISKASLQSVFFMLLFSVACGFSWGVVFEFLDDVIRSAHDVRRYLNLPVLGSIPKVQEVKDSLFLDGDQRSPLVEAFHKVGYQVESVCFDVAAKALLFTSSRAEEGKTTILSNLGFSLATSGESVLLVDGDIRRPSLHLVFHTDNTLGLSNILSGELEQKGLTLQQSVDAALKGVGKERLLFLPAGPPVSNPVELLRSAKMKEVVSILKQKASLVLMDSSPLIAVIDPVIEASYLDGIVLIVDSSKTRRKEILQSKQLLSNLKLPILGVILNQVMIEAEDYYYYYSRYGGYSSKRTKK